jgi:hypothetical protein
MRTTLHLAAVCAGALLWAMPASAATILVDDPSVVVKEVTNSLADARADDAILAITKYICSSPAQQFNFASLAAAFKLLTQPGKADLVEEIWNNKYGSSIEDIVEYLHFPPSDNPVNQFIFLRYTFMKSADGWQFTNITFATSGVFPPPNWTRF